MAGFLLAGAKGFEPSIFSVTGRRVNRATPRTHACLSGENVSWGADPCKTGGGSLGGGFLDLRQTVDFGGEDEIVVREAADGVGGELEFDLIPGTMDVGVMAFRFSEGTDGVDKAESFVEIFEGVFVGNRLGISGQIPAVHFGGKFESFVALEGGDAAFAGDAFLFVEGFVHILCRISHDTLKTNRSDLAKHDFFCYLPFL